MAHQLSTSMGRLVWTAPGKYGLQLMTDCRCLIALNP